MNKVYTLTLIALIAVTSCKSVSKLTKKGNYEEAVNYAISKFDKNKKLNTKDVKSLERAHRQLAANELSEVQLKAKNPRYKYQDLYRDIEKINRVQKKLKPYLPIKSKSGYRAKFNFINVGKLQEESYKEATRRDLFAIDAFKNKKQYLDAYYAYLSMAERQSFLSTHPLLIGVDGYKPNLIPEDIGEDMERVRGLATAQTYDDAIGELNKYKDTGKKKFARTAFAMFKEVESLDRNYKDTHALIEEAHELGTLHVLIKMENRSFNMLPMGMEFDVLRNDFNNLNRKWVRYYNQEFARQQYDVISVLELNQLDISREYENVRKNKVTDKVKDGWEYVLDKNGNVSKDSLGNDIKKDKFKEIQGKFMTIEMSKYAQIGAKVIYHNVATRQTKYSSNMDVKYIFEEEYYDFRGDERLITSNMRNKLKKRRPRYPSDMEILRLASDLLREKLEKELSRQIYYDSWFRD